MRRFYISIISIFILTGIAVGQSKSYRTFEWDIIRVGYAFASADNLNSGIALSSEPRINITDNFSAGIRWEIALFDGEEVNDNTTELDGATSTVLIGDYYFKSNSPYRGFAGLGVGRYESGDFTIIDDDNVDFIFDGATSAGILTRVGFEVGHLRLSAEYNYLFKEEASNYFGLHAGLTLWGGYKGTQQVN